MRARYFYSLLSRSPHETSIDYRAHMSNALARHLYINANDRCNVSHHTWCTCILDTSHCSRLYRRIINNWLWRNVHGLFVFDSILRWRKGTVTERIDLINSKRRGSLFFFPFSFLLSSFSVNHDSRGSRVAADMLERKSVGRISPRYLAGTRARVYPRNIEYKMQMKAEPLQFTDHIYEIARHYRAIKYVIAWIYIFNGTDLARIGKRHQNSTAARIIYDYPCYDRCFENRDPCRPKIEGLLHIRQAHSNRDRESSCLLNYGLSRNRGFIRSGHVSFASYMSLLGSNNGSRYADRWRIMLENNASSFLRKRNANQSVKRRTFADCSSIRQSDMTTIARRINYLLIY